MVSGPRRVTVFISCGNHYTACYGLFPSGTVTFFGDQINVVVDEDLSRSGIETDALRLA